MVTDVYFGVLSVWLFSIRHPGRLKNQYLE